MLHLKDEAYIKEFAVSFHWCHHSATKANSNTSAANGANAAKDAI